jgi:hypothetical protein
VSILFVNDESCCDWRVHARDTYDGGLMTEFSQHAVGGSFEGSASNDGRDCNDIVSSCTKRIVNPA